MRDILKSQVSLTSWEKFETSNPLLLWQCEACELIATSHVVMDRFLVLVHLVLDFIYIVTINLEFCYT